MGALSKVITLTRYRIDGHIPENIAVLIPDGINKFMYPEIEDDLAEHISGWTSMRNYFTPDPDENMIIGDYAAFSLRIDKKSVPAKAVNKHVTIEAARVLSESGKSFLSKSEKREIKDRVTSMLMLKMPLRPDVYDVIWDLGKNEVRLFSGLQAVSDEFETLFIKSFGLKLIRLFPYTLAEFCCDLSNAEKDAVLKLTPTSFGI